MKKIYFSDLIVYEDKDYIFVNKPAGVATLDDRDRTRTSIIRLAKTYAANLQIGHRLDKETSGILAVAKHAQAYRHLSICFEKKRVEKTYHALVKGVHHFENTLVNRPIATSNTGNVRIDSTVGKTAQTILNTLKFYSWHTLLSCYPLTGRMHQIRIHLAYLHAPIVADIRYGGEWLYLSALKKKFKLKRDTLEYPLIKRVALHAYALKFTNHAGEEIYARAPYPKDMSALLRQLEKNA